MKCAVKQGQRQNQIGAVGNPKGFQDHCESSVEESGFKSSDFGCASFCLPDLWGASSLCRVLFSSAITRPFLASQIPSKMKGIVAPERKIRGSQRSWFKTCVSCMVLVTLAITSPSDPKETVPMETRRKIESEFPRCGT